MLIKGNGIPYLKVNVLLLFLFTVLVSHYFHHNKAYKSPKIASVDKKTMLIFIPCVRF